MSSIYTQPHSNAMSMYPGSIYADEKHPQQCYLHHPDTSSCECVQPSSHRACHRTRLRRLLVPALLAVLLCGLLAIWFAMDTSFLDAIFFGQGSPGVLAKRADSSFTQNKLYLIIIFVGLLLVVIATIMLSFWCCKGAFQNPLCCPCYLCACCGGLACLECIGCGLCAAGLEEM